MSLEKYRGHSETVATPAHPGQTLNLSIPVNYLDGWSLFVDKAANMDFRLPSHFRQMALRTLALICVLLLNANVTAMAQFDSTGYLGAMLEVQSGYPDSGDSSPGHDSHQCNLIKNLNLRDSSSQIFPQTNKSLSFDRSYDIAVGQSLLPLLHPPRP